MTQILPTNPNSLLFTFQATLQGHVSSLPIHHISLIVRRHLIHFNLSNTKHPTKNTIEFITEWTTFSSKTQVKLIGVDFRQHPNCLTNVSA